MLLANVLQPLEDVEETVLEGLHSIGLGWGLAIVGLTLIVRLATLPLVVRQFRSQREMRRHAPELKALRERHRDDPARMQRETIAYYREHRINPLGALAPLLVQIPVFISLYLLLRSDASDGLFGDSGFLFIPSLTEKPHGVVLAVMITLYLCSQVGSQAIATRAMDWRGRRLMLAMPVLFVTVIARFPAGLAIYSITTSLWSFGQRLALLAGVPGLRSSCGRGRGIGPVAPRREPVRR